MQISPPFTLLRNPNSSPSSTRSRRRNRTPLGFQHSGRDRNRAQPSRTVVAAKAPGENLAMEHVKILKRGEVLKPPPPTVSRRRSRDEDLALSSTVRLGPEPETVQNQIRVSELKAVDGGLYAFSYSPPPSSLPIPAFFSKKE